MTARVKIIECIAHQINKLSMKLSIFLLSACVLIGSTPAFAQVTSSKEILYAGSFSEKGGKGIYVFRFDRGLGKLTQLQTVSIGKAPSFLAINPDQKFLYAIYDEGTIAKDGDGSILSFKIDPATGFLTKLNEQSSEGRGPAHISVDPRGRFVYVSNYGSGTLAVYPINKDGSLAKATDVIQDKGKGPHPNQKGPHVHSVIPSAEGKYIYVCDLGIDKVFIYKVNTSGKLSPAKTPYVNCTPGSGPRQFAISPDGQYAFLVEELISTLVSFRRNPATGALTPLEHFEMLPDGYEEKGSDATVFVSPDSRFVYASNWGPKGIVIYSIDHTTGKLTLVDRVDLHGTHPRDFCIDKKGEYVFVANMGSGNMVVFKRDTHTGKLTFTGEEAKVPNISCIEQLFL